MTYRLRAEYVPVESSTRGSSPDSSANSVHDHVKRGSAHRRKKRFDEAVAEYDKALQIEPNNLDIHRVKALAFHLKGDLNSATQTYESSARLYRKQGQFKQADAIQEMLSGGLQSLPDHLK